MRIGNLFYEEKEDGTFDIGFIEENVKVFNHQTYKLTCHLDKKNYQKFKKKIGSLENIVKLFSDKFYVNEFNKFCNKHEIKYTHEVRIGD